MTSENCHQHRCKVDLNLGPRRLLRKKPSDKVGCIFLMVQETSSEFCKGQNRDDNHHEDASHFTIMILNLDGNVGLIRVAWIYLKISHYQKYPKMTKNDNHVMTSSSIKLTFIVISSISNIPISDANDSSSGFFWKSFDFSCFTNLFSMVTSSVRQMSRVTLVCHVTHE